MQNVLIIGSGCAGNTAAVYAARANLKPLVVMGKHAGGQLSLTTLVENFPGFPMGIHGPELVENIKLQAQNFGAEYIHGDVVDTELTRRPFRINVEGEWIETRTLIIASGASARWLGLDSETRLRGFGVSSCATCDGFFFRDRELVVVGGGDTAMEEALFLARIASKVTVVHRRDEFRASRIMADRVLGHPKIAVRWNAEVQQVIGDGVVEGVELRDAVTGAVEVIPAAAVFVAIGHDPNTDLFVDQLDLDPSGYILTDGTRTSVEGVFACGDVQDTVYRQAITAAASGCMAAIDSERWLEAALHQASTSGQHA